MGGRVLARAGCGPSVEYLPGGAVEARLSGAAAGRRAAMRSTLDDHATDPHNPRDSRQDTHTLT